MRVFANVNISSDSFFSWLIKTNDMLTAFSETVTVKANTAGDTTTGNGFVTGVFGANTLVATNVRGGNVTSSSALSFQTNINFGNTSSQIFLNMNNIEETKVSNYVSSNTNVQLFDSFLNSSFRSGKYIISMTSGSNYQFTELAILQNSSNSFMTEYATLSTNTNTLGTFSTNTDSGITRLYVTPANAVTNFKYKRNLLVI